MEIYNHGNTMAQFVDENNLFLSLLYILSCATHTHTHTHTHTCCCCSVTVMKDAVQSLYWFGVFKGSDTIIIIIIIVIIIIISPSDGRCVCVRSRVSASIICLGPFPRSQVFELFQPSIIFFHHRSLNSSLRLVYVNELCCDWLTSSHVK